MKHRSLRPFVVFALLSLVFVRPTLRAERIVSLAPALTEIVFALGKGGELVGVTRFCDYPAAVKSIPRVGGMLDLNLESLVALRPSVVLLYPELEGKVALVPNCRRVVVPHFGLQDLYTAIRQISVALGVASAGEKLNAEIRGGLADVQRAAAGRAPQRVMVVAGRTPDQLSTMFIIGRRDFLSELLPLAGGRNCYEGEVLYPSISMESVIAMRPDVILEISAHYEGLPEEPIRAQWRRYAMIPAVQRNRIWFVHDSFWLRPGPRVVQIARELLRLLQG